MCVGQMSSTAAQCDRSIMSLANKDEHSWPTSSFVPPVPTAATIGREMPGPTAGARMGCNRSALYWPLNQQLTLRPQMRAEHAGKRHSRYFAPGQTDQFAPEQSRVGPKPDGLAMNRHRASGYCFSVISAQTLRVCREGKSLYTSCFGFCLPLAWSRQATGDTPESLFSTWVANKVPTACAVHASGVSPEEIRQPVT